MYRTTSVSIYEAPGELLAIHAFVGARYYIDAITSHRLTRGCMHVIWQPPRPLSASRKVPRKRFCEYARKWTSSWRRPRRKQRTAIRVPRVAGDRPAPSFSSCSALLCLLGGRFFYRWLHMHVTRVCVCVPTAVVYFFAFFALCRPEEVLIGLRLVVGWYTRDSAHAHDITPLSPSCLHLRFV